MSCRNKRIDWEWVASVRNPDVSMQDYTNDPNDHQQLMNILRQSKKFTDTQWSPDLQWSLDLRLRLEF